MSVLRRAGLLALLLMGLSGPVRAQEFVSDLCRPTLTTPPRYDTPEQVRWYKRFWTGECDRLVGCFSGAPHWSAIVSQLMSRAKPGDRAAILPKACRLGQMVGVEWSRARNIKRITTGDLRTLYGQLEAASDPGRGLDQIEAIVRGKLGR